MEPTRPARQTRNESIVSDWETIGYRVTWGQKDGLFDSWHDHAEILSTSKRVIKLLKEICPRPSERIARKVRNLKVVELLNRPGERRERPCGLAGWEK